jgi:hypothetical protein
MKSSDRFHQAVLRAGRQPAQTGAAADGDRRSPDHPRVAQQRAGEKVEITIPRQGKQQRTAQDGHRKRRRDALAPLRRSGRPTATAKPRRSTELQNARAERPAQPDRVLRHLQHPGHRCVGSMVVFEQGVPKKASTGASTSAASAARTTSPAWRRCSTGASTAGRPPRRTKSPAASLTRPFRSNCPTCS